MAQPVTYFYIFDTFSHDESGATDDRPTWDVEITVTVRNRAGETATASERVTLWNSALVRELPECQS